MLLLSQTDGQWPPLHKEIYANTVGARIARPFRNKCYFYLETGRRRRRPLQQCAIKTVTILSNIRGQTNLSLPSPG